MAKQVDRAIGVQEGSVVAEEDADEQGRALATISVERVRWSSTLWLVGGSQNAIRRGPLSFAMLEVVELAVAGNGDRNQLQRRHPRA